MPTIGAPNILSAFLGICAGCILGSKRTTVGIKLLIPTVVYILSAWYIVGGYNYWFNFLGGGSFTGKEDTQMPKGWYTYSQKPDTFNTDFYKNKLVLLDFWNTSCGVCFIKFPDLENLYQKYRFQENFIIQSVNIPIDRDTSGMAFKMVAQYNKYSFPVVVGNEDMKSVFNINAYPTVLLIKNGRVIFRGRLELAEKVLSDIFSQN